MYGGVGRGKSFLMDCFFQSRAAEAQDAAALPRVHARGAPRAAGPEGHASTRCEELGRRIARRFRLICFDEFHVADVTDAMILHRLLEALFANRVSIVTTSNFHPDGAVPERPAPRPHPAGDRAAEGSSSRWSTSTPAPTTASARWSRSRCTTTPLGAAADAAMAARLRAAGRGARRRPACCTSSTASCARGAAPAAWSGSTSRTLCGGPRSQNDYLETRLAVPHGAAVRRAADVAAPGQRGAALHLAGRRAVRPARQADPVGRGRRRKRSTPKARWRTSSRAPCRGCTRCSRPSSWRWRGARSTPRSHEAAPAASGCSLLLACAARCAAPAADDRARPASRAERAGAARAASRRTSATASSASPSRPASTTCAGAAPRGAGAAARTRTAARRRRATAARRRRGGRPSRPSRRAQAARPPPAPRAGAVRLRPPPEPASSASAASAPRRQDADDAQARAAQAAERAQARSNAGAKRPRPTGSACERRLAEREAAGKVAAPLPVPSARRASRAARGRPRPRAGGSGRLRAPAGPRLSASASTRTSASDRLSPPPRARWRALLTSISLASRGGSACTMAPSSLRREVVPQAVAAGQQRVAELEPVDVRTAPAAGPACVPRQPVSRLRLRVRVGLFLGDLAFVDQALHEGMVDGALHHLGAAEVVDARIAGVHDVAFAASGPIRKAATVLCGSSSAVIAVSLIIRCDFQHQLAQQCRRRRPCAARSARRAGVPSAAPGRRPCARRSCRPCRRPRTRQHAARHAVVRDDLDLVLLVGPVAAVQAGGGSEAEGRVTSGASWREYKLAASDPTTVPQWTTTCIRRSAG